MERGECSILSFHYGWNVVFALLFNKSFLTWLQIILPVKHLRFLCLLPLLIISAATAQVSISFCPDLKSDSPPSIYLLGYNGMKHLMT